MTFTVDFPDWKWSTWLLVVGVPYCIFCWNLAIVLYRNQYKDKIIYDLQEKDCYYALIIFSPIYFPSLGLYRVLLNLISIICFPGTAISRMKEKKK